MASYTREKIFKSWSLVPEVTLIKEVATKGEHVQLCIDYLAGKNEIPLDECKQYFHDVVDSYVARLLGEKLVCKAENVLKNVHRNVKCVFLEFGFECCNEEVKEAIVEHLKKKDPVDFEEEMRELYFYYCTVAQIKNHPELLERAKKEISKRLSLETFFHLSEQTQKKLMAKLYMITGNANILSRIKKQDLWDCLVEGQHFLELIKWCYATETNSEENDFSKWPVEVEMYEFALNKLKNPPDPLRNHFARKGFIFADEKYDVQMALQRICSSESFKTNKEVIDKLAIGRFIMDKPNLYPVLLRDFVSTRELEEIRDSTANNKEFLDLILSLKNHDTKSRGGFQQIAYSVRSYLDSKNLAFDDSSLSLVEFLLNDANSVSSLNAFLHSNQMTYLTALAKRLETSQPLPTPYDFLKRFKNLDFHEICNESGVEEVASFSNPLLCEKFSRKYQLNFLHYLKQQRSSYAAYFFFVEHLKSYSQITKAQLFTSTETVAELALQSSTNPDLVAHCVAFSEMLGFDTQNLRSFIKLSRMSDCEENENQFFGFGDLLVNCEQRLSQNLDVFPLSEYTALMRIAECNQFKKWPEAIIEKYCRANDWWKILVLVQFFDMPLEQIKRISRLFRSREVGEHIIRALSYEPSTEKPKRRPSVSRQKARSIKYENLPSTTSAETMTSSMSSSNDPNALFKASNQIRFLHENDSLDIFSIILLSSNTIPEERIFSDLNKFLEIILDSHSYSTSVNLMKNSIKYNLPILSLLSATVSSQNLDWNWLIWLAVSTDFWKQTLSNINMLSYGTNQTVFALMALIEHCVCDGYVQTLFQSFDIFYKDTPISHFTKFLHETNQHNFSEDVVNELRMLLLAWSNDELEFPLCENMKKDQKMLQITRLLMLHLRENFTSRFYQDMLLTLVCQSGISDISGIVDFCLLKEAFMIIRSIPSIEINFMNLLERGNMEYDYVLSVLLETKRYDEAIKLSSLLSLPISEIVYAKWISDVESLDSEIQDFDRYEEEIRVHSLPPEILVTFFLFSAGRLTQLCSKKYMLLKRALDVIKSNHLFPNESFDRDQIEYDMVLCYLQIPEEDVDKLEIYYSEYYEEIMLKERCVLFKSFLELKELAGIEDLTTSLKTELTEKMKLRLALLLNKLLDDGDIVEALRLQALFEYRPIDLHFIVFCMALAEGLTTMLNLSREERQMLSEIEKSSFSKFNKRTLGNLKPSGPSSPHKYGDLSDSSSTMELLEFEEIPPKEKQETLNAIQGIASKLKFGVNLGKRIVMTYRAAMYLDKEYIDVLRTKDQGYLLKKATQEDCLHKLLAVSDIFTSTQMTPMEIAEYLSFEIATAVIRPRFYMFEVDQQPKSINQLKNSVLWGFNLERELHLFLELCPSTTLLGNSLLEFCDALKTYRKFQDGKAYDSTDALHKLSEIIRLYGLPNATPGTTQVLSHKKQNLIYVELLIKAHQCFVHECSMEGIANVLNRAKALNTILTNAKSWSLIVRMLIGLARYREMFYCFDSLIKNDQFESLLGQFEEYKAVSLRQAILTYLREYCPDNKDYLKLAGLHFSMYKELAEMWEVEGRDVLAHVMSSSSQTGGISSEQLKISSQHASSIPKLKCTQELSACLNQALEYFTHATESYLMDNKLLPAQKSVSMAELVAMQIDLVQKGMASGTCVSVLSVQSREDLKELVYSELRVPQAMILSRAYSIEINWSEAILFQYVVLKRKDYITEFQCQMQISDTIIENIVKGFQIYSVSKKVDRQMEENLCALVDHVQSIALKYKLASLLNMKSTVMALLNEQTIYYLKDTNYGRNEGNMAEV